MAPAASWVGLASRPPERVAPVTGLSVVTASLETDCGVSPPAMTSRDPSARTTSRETAAGSWYAAGVA
jgi:hypothetical protein